MQFRGTATTKPNQNMWCIRPEKRSNLTSHFHRRFGIKSLDRFYIYSAVIKITFGVMFSMETFSFAVNEFILIHISYHLSRRTARVYLRKTEGGLQLSRDRKFR
jgi:hypothetical protein